MSDTPDDLRYSRDHLWVRREAGDGMLQAGVTDFAQQSLGDVVDVRPPGPGDAITAGEPCGEIESTKSINELIAPVTGTIRERNDDLSGSPDLVNADPYGQGWIFDVEVDASTLDRQLASLLGAADYHAVTGE
jgi:glycine cleavage system H protein